MDDGFAMGYAMGQDSGGGRNDSDGGFGGANSWIWIIVVFALLFGWGNNGNRGGNSGGGGGGETMAAYIPYLASAVNTSGALTRADLCSEFAFNDLNRAVEGVNTGLCDGFYTTGMQLSNGFAGVNSAICNLGYNNAQLANNLGNTIMQGFNASNIAQLQGQNAIQSQLAQCCCDNRTGQMQLGTQIERGFCDTNYTAATNTTAIIQNAHNDTDRVLAKLDAMEMARKDETIDALRSQVNALNLAQSQANQNNYLVNHLRPCPTPAYITCNPWASQAPYGSCASYGGGCGC